MIWHEEFPPSRLEIKKRFGYLSFQCSLINIDVYGLEIIKHEDYIILLYQGNKKVGFINECKKLTEEQVFKLYKTIPSANELYEFSEKHFDKIKIYNPEPNNFIFISDDVVTTKSVLNKTKKELNNENRNNQKGEDKNKKIL